MSWVIIKAKKLIITYFQQQIFTCEFLLFDSFIHLYNKGQSFQRQFPRLHYTDPHGNLPLKKYLLHSPTSPNGNMPLNRSRLHSLTSSNGNFPLKKSLPHSPTFPNGNVPLDKPLPRPYLPPMKTFLSTSPSLILIVWPSCDSCILQDNFSIIIIYSFQII